MKKFILALTMPSGSMYVLAPRENGLGLFPVVIGEENIIKDCFSFDTVDEANEWIRKSSELNPKSKKLLERVEPYEAVALP